MDAARFWFKENYVCSSLGTLVMRERSYVRVTGLRGRSELNGRYGKLLQWIQKKINAGRCSWNAKTGAKCKALCLSKGCPEFQTTYMSRLLPCKLHGAVSAPCFPQEFCDKMKSRPQSLSRESALEFLLNWLLAATELRWQRTLSGQHSLQTSKNSFDSLELGDLLPQHFKQHDVHNFRTNFSNSNSTHAGIGFNDLRLLPDARIEKGASGIRFTGIHLNDFSVTKALVIAAMLMDKNISANHILQVWYSSTWSKGTFSSFKKTMLAMEPPILRAGMKQFLEFWKSAEAPDLASCRQQWLQHFVSDERKWDACTIASLIRPCDQLAACKYFVTGEVCDESLEKPEVGRCW
jgi:hypothetical protein